MKAITFRGVEQVAVARVADPVLQSPEDAIVRVSSAGLCGSDLHPYFGREAGLDVGTVMGHEFVGRVEEVGAGVTGLRPGQRVVSPFTTSCGACVYCRMGLTARCERGQLFGWVQGGEGLHGGQAEAVRVPLAGSTLVPVPDELDDAVALLAGDVLSTAVFGASLAGVAEGELVVVVGCGPVGVLAVRAALERGAREVVAIDTVASRLAMATLMGATAVHLQDGDPLATVRERSAGTGADCAIEAVGSPEATRLAADLVRAGGRIGAVGVHTEPHLALSPGELYDRNLRYAAGRCSARHYLPGALELALRDQDLLLHLISHRLPLEDGPEAYRRFGAREEGWSKVVFQI
jgi:threonine dehydrogenase-like Zn-dependent dehydrogenase